VRWREEKKGKAMCSFCGCGPTPYSKSRLPNSHCVPCISRTLMEGRSGQPFAARVATSWNLQVPAAITLGVDCRLLFFEPVDKLGLRLVQQYNRRTQQEAKRIASAGVDILAFWPCGLATKPLIGEGGFTANTSSRRVGASHQCLGL
jgi:hypothetical protein